MNTILYKGEQYLVYTVRRYSQPMELELTRVFCVPSRYPDGTLAVTLRREETPHEVFAVITRNLSGMQDAVQPQECQAYLDTKGCVGWLLPFLLENRLAAPTGHAEPAFADSVHLWKFDMERFFAGDVPAGTSFMKPLEESVPEQDATQEAIPEAPPPTEEDFFPPEGPYEAVAPADPPTLFDHYDDLPPDDCMM